MNRRQFFAVSMLPVTAAAIGIPVFARIPHFVLLANDGEVVARSEELPAEFLQWLRQPEHTVECVRDIQLIYRPDREATVSHYELRDCDVSQEFKRRRSLDEPIWLGKGDKLDFTWRFKAERESRSRFGGTLQ